MEAPVVIAAIITGLVTVVGFLFQGWFLATRIERLRSKGAQELQAFEHNFKAYFAHQDNRREALSRLLNAVSIARSAAKNLVDDCDSSDLDKRLSSTLMFVQRITVFFNEAKSAPTNIALELEDVKNVSDVQKHLVRLVLALDPDAAPDNYAKRLKPQYQALDAQATAFETYVRKLVPRNPSVERGAPRAACPSP